MYTQSTAKVIFWIILSKGRDFSYYDFASSESVYTHSQNHPKICIHKVYVLFGMIWILGNPQTPDELYEQKNLGVSFRKNYSTVFKIW